MRGYVAEIFAEIVCQCSSFRCLLRFNGVKVKQAPVTRGD